MRNSCVPGHPVLVCGGMTPHELRQRTDKDFIAKLGVVIEEADETAF